MASAPSLVDLARKITASAEYVEQHLREQGLPLPSFDENGPKNMVLADKEAERHRLVAASAAAELQDLLLGPHASLTTQTNNTGLEALYRWNVAANVPRDGEISYPDLASRVGLREDMLKRVVRYVIPANRCFHEKRDGYVSHSAASRLLCDSSDLYNTIGMMYTESWRAFTKTCDSIEQFDSEEPSESGFSLEFCPGRSMWEYYKEYPQSGLRFARAMESLAQRPGFSLTPLTAEYPWWDLQAGSRVIDLGGGQGHASIAICKQYPDLRFVVQDLPDVIEAARRLPDVPKAVEFMEHDFLTQQPLQGELFLFRWVLHDWPDKYVVKILQNLVPALRDGAKVVINDSVMPKLGSIPLLLERRVRQYDMTMQALFNSKEREEHEWHELFRRADPRFQKIRSWTPKGAVLAIIEATWTDPT